MLLALLLGLEAVYSAAEAAKDLPLLVASEHTVLPALSNLTVV